MQFIGVLYIVFSCLTFILSPYCEASLQTLDIPPDHMPQFFTNYPHEATKCAEDDKCQFKAYLGEALCWGYEQNCTTTMTKATHVCPGDHRGWVKTKREQLETFYAQGDFGFVKERRDSLQHFCVPHEDNPSSSSLECSKDLQFCRGTNIFLNLTRLLERKTPVRYHMDVLQPGDVRGHCRLKEDLLARNLKMMSALQSWAPELQHFQSSSQSPADWDCDVWYHKPVIITKIDASVSLYHHFCDFFNLYAAQHVNNTHPSAFSTDVQVLIWETYPYRSSFGEAWKAFTRHPLQTLADVAGKRLCFRQVMFPLLPRMIFGLFYNTPLIWGCEKSALFRAFTQHMLHRLRVSTRDSVASAAEGDGRVRVTLLARQTQHRRILNQEALIDALRGRSDIILKLAQFEHGHDFRLQLQAMADTDLLIGMHGAGLTHLLFLPDWGAVFELYNCGDEHCYKDLARLRGLAYFTWEREKEMRAEDEGHHPQLGAHEKFTNYEFSPPEFVRLVDKGIRAVKRHPKWQQHNKRQLRDEL